MNYFPLIRVSTRMLHLGWHNSREKNIPLEDTNKYGYDRLAELSPFNNSFYASTTPGLAQ